MRRIGVESVQRLERPLPSLPQTFALSRKCDARAPFYAHRRVRRARRACARLKERAQRVHVLLLESLAHVPARTPAAAFLDDRYETGTAYASALACNHTHHSTVRRENSRFEQFMID